jgi:hypothetical protein
MYLGRIVEHTDKATIFARPLQTSPAPGSVGALHGHPFFRKVAGGFRAEWGAKVYAAAANVIATGRLHGLTALPQYAHSRAGSHTRWMIPIGQ